MFKEVEIIYTVICDECGLDCCDDTPYIGWKKKEDVLEAAKEECWLEINGRHVCPTCWHKVYEEQFEDED